MQKKILITGENSYIAKAADSYLCPYQDEQGRFPYQVSRISLRGDAWRQISFKEFDTVLHMAGIAHVDVGQVTEAEKRQYYKINCDLAVETAQKARDEGVSQFIYMSSVIVFGDSAPAGGEKIITAAAVPAPANFYGDSKYQAELRLRELETNDFRVAIVRSPMVYGRNSRGNFSLLAGLAQKTPVFPNFQNQRSMIYIENLTEFFRLLAESGRGGVFYPQNAEYVGTARMIQAIAAAQGRRIRLWGALNPFVRLAARMPGGIGRMANKAFGSLTIDQSLSAGEIDGYRKYGLEESIGRIYEG